MAMGYRYRMRGIEPAVHEVHEEVHDDEDRRHEEHQGLGQRVVPVGDRLDEEQPEAVQVEDLLRHHEPAHEEGELDARHRQHRQHRVLERVALEDERLHQALGARGADVVLAQHLEHRGAGHAGGHRRVAVADGEGGPDELEHVLPRVDPEGRVDHGRQPVENHEQRQDHQDAEPERRRGDARDGDDAHHVVDPRVLLERGRHT